MCVCVRERERERERKRERANESERGGRKRTDGRRKDVRERDRLKGYVLTN